MIGTDRDATRDGLPLVTGIQVQLAPVERSADVEVLAAYHLELREPTKRILLLDPAVLNVLSTSLSAGAHVGRGRVKNMYGSEMAAIELTPTRGEFNGNLVLENESHWTPASRERHNGSPVLAFSNDLPAVVTDHYLFDASPMRPDAAARQLPSVSVQASWAAPSGEVRNAHGVPTMCAVFARSSASTTWHADERLVLTGDALADESAELRAALRDLLLELHGFFGDLYGNAHNVRVLAVAEAGAFDYKHNGGQCCWLDRRMIGRSSSGWFPVARLVAREMAAMWWCSGVRLVGAYGWEMSLGLGIASTMHWLRSVGRKDDLRAEFEGAERRVSAGQLAGTVAIAVARAAASDTTIHTRLREFCTEHWGMTVPYSRIVALLSEMGIGLPKALFQTSTPSGTTPLLQRVGRQMRRLRRP